MTRAGVALVFALGLMALVMAVTVLWVSSAARTQSSVHAWLSDAHVWAQEQAGESLAIAWLADQGGHLVAPPAGGSWTIVADRWSTTDTSGWLTVTVYDGWAGLPPHLVAPSGVLRRYLPTEFTGLPFLATTIIQPGTASDLLMSLPLPPGIRRFPPVPTGPPVTAESWQPPPSLRSSALAAEVPEQVDFSASALGLSISPHSDGRINCNTAPLKVVEHVLRLQGALTLADLRRNRERGVLSTPPPDPGGIPGHPLLVASTEVWNVHITAAWQGTIKSWWVVVVGSGQVPRIVQRHVVDP